MKLDILNRKWLDIVFEGRNKAYGAYDLRKDNPRTTLIALLIGATFFSLFLSAPLLANLLPKDERVPETKLDGPVVLVNMEPKVEKPKVFVESSAPSVKVDVKKFSKLVADRAENIVEDPPTIIDLKNVQTGQVNIVGDPSDVPTITTHGNNSVDITGGEDPRKIYLSSGIQVPAEFPGGVDAFRIYIAKNFVAPTDYGFKGGQLYVSFIVEIDGSISTINVARDPGFGTAKEAERVIKSNKVKWIPGEQNGRKVRMLFTLPIKVQAPRN